MARARTVRIYRAFTGEYRVLKFNSNSPTSGLSFAIDAPDKPEYFQCDTSTIIISLRYIFSPVVPDPLTSGPFIQLQVRGRHKAFLKQALKRPVHDSWDGACLSPSSDSGRFRVMWPVWNSGTAHARFVWLCAFGVLDTRSGAGSGSVPTSRAQGWTVDTGTVIVIGYGELCDMLRDYCGILTGCCRRVFLRFSLVMKLRVLLAEDEEIRVLRR